MVVQSRWLTALGSVFVILGGVVAAVTGPLEFAKGSWLAAYLVLVCGVPQNAVGWIAGGRLTVSRGWVLVAGWNIGNGAVIAGTLTGLPYVVDLGGLVLLVPLVVLLWVLLRAVGPGGIGCGACRALGAHRAVGGADREYPDRARAGTPPGGLTLRSLTPSLRRSG